MEQAMKRGPVWIALGGVAALLAIVGALYIKQLRAPEETPFTIAKVDRGEIIQSVATTGQLIPRTSVEVSSQISGLLTEVTVDYNTPVKKGQVLARVDPSSYEQALQQANANLTAARAAYTLADLDSKRLQGLQQEDLVTQQEGDVAEAQRRQSEALFLTALAAVRNAKVNLERCTITSPIDGIVVFKQAEVGKTVVSSFSAPTLFVIAQDLSQMRILAPISEVDVRAIHIGQDVTFTVDAIPGRNFGGRLTQIRAPYVPTEKQTFGSQQTSVPTFESVIDVDNVDLILQPSLTANVLIIVARRRNVLRIPNGALRIKFPDGMHISTSNAESPPRQNESTVYRVPGGDRKALPEAVKVRLGTTDSLMTEVSNLNEGDAVITGIPVIARGEKRALFN